MITFICLIVVIYIIIKIWCDKTSNDKIVSTVWMLVLGFMFSLMISIFFSIIFRDVELKRLSYKDRIYSIKNSDGINGSFVLGSGQINTVENYYYFRKDNRGGFYRDTSRASSSYLFQDEDKEPFMSWQNIYYRPSKWIILWPVFVVRKEQTSIDFHVPKNTIIEQFKIQ